MNARPLHSEHVDGDTITASLLPDGTILLDGGAAGAMHVTAAQMGVLGRAAEAVKTAPQGVATVLQFPRPAAL